MGQLALKFAERKTIDERFAEFDRLNPHVFEEFARAARRLREKGHKRYSAKGIFEYLRYERALQTTRIGEYALNNVFTSRMSRKLIEQDPTFGDFFELRKIRSE